MPLSSIPTIPNSQYVPLVEFPTLKNPRTRTRLSSNGAFSTRITMPTASTQSGDADNDKPTKLVTFLGKGGSGKTTAAVFAAQHYAVAGLNTCLVTHSQDLTAECLLNHKFGTSPTECSENLSAVRLETSKMFLEPLNRLKQADARLNMTQGVLEGVVGEELGVLPGMDSIFSALALERLVGFSGNVAKRDARRDKFDIIIYDGISTEETLRMIGATSKARLYLKYLRNLAEKTDLGRLAGPSLLRLVDEALSLTSQGSSINGKLSSETWDYLEQLLERASYAISDLQNFSCYIVMDPRSAPSTNCALRYWGCAIQAGTQVSGAICTGSPNSPAEIAEGVMTNFSPLPFAFIPHLPVGAQVDWRKLMSDTGSENARDLFSVASTKGSTVPPVKFDPATKSVTLFMPGFDKSEIKLYQFRGGSELLVEAGDQRRVIRLPSQIQGKVGGAKFIERSVVITMR